MIGLDAVNAFFDRIFVITIPRNTERQERIRRDLAGLEWQFWPGVDGRLLDEDAVRAVYDDAGAVRHFGRSLIAGEIGLALSHRGIYDAVLQHDWRRVLILEDDVHLAPAGVASFPALTRELPEAWDVLYACTYRSEETWQLRIKLAFLYPALHTLRLRRYDVAAARKEYSQECSRYLRRAGRHFGTWAYAVTRRGAERLRALQTPVTMPSDVVLGTFSVSPASEVFLAKSNLFEHREDAGSTIQEPARGG